MTEFFGQDLAQKAYDANVTARFKRLNHLERVVDGTQYDGKASFWNDDVALLERAPCFVYTLVASAIRSHASMVLGEGRFPRFTTHGDEDGAKLDEQTGISTKDSAVLDPLIAAMVKRAKLRPAAKRLLERALGCGTAVAIACARGGRLCVDTTRAKWCTPEFDPENPGVITKLEIRYPYFEEYVDGSSGKPAVRTMLYRRVIDAQRDVTYRPERANRNGAEPVWREAQAIEHNLGFCPAIWYKFMADEASVAQLDGHAIHAPLVEEIYGFDLARSQLHRAAVTTLDPIMTEIGVDEDETPGPLGDQPRIYIGNPETDPASSLWGYMPTGKVRKGRKRSPGMAYRYTNQNAKVDLLTLPGDALKAGFDNVADLEEKICEMLSWRPIDPETMKQSALSGRALEWLHRRQIDFDNEIRTDFGDNCLLPLIDMMLRIALVLKRQGKHVALPGIDKALSILERFEMEQETGNDNGVAKVWVAPDIDPIWPPYFPPTEVDQKAIGDMVRADLLAKIITLRTAVQKNAGFYAISDVDEYVKTLEQAEAQRAADMHDAETLLNGAPDAGDMRRMQDDKGDQPAAVAKREGQDAAPAPSAKTAKSQSDTPAVRLPKGKLLGGRKAA